MIKSSIKRGVDKTEMKKYLKIIIQILIVFAAVALIASYMINAYVTDSTLARVYKSDELPRNEYSCILILGCGVRKDGTPSDMLRDRLDTGIKLYKSGAAPKIIMSGDHGKDGYDEVNTMKEYAKNTGVSSEDIFMDHAGFSTYESIYRAKEIFNVESVIVVTQKFHTCRALFIADKLKVKAVAVSADKHDYRGIKYVELREYVARNKDFLLCIVKPEPKYLGEVIPVTGNGDVTNDR